jgi:hypothetical protein
VIRVIAPSGHGGGRESGLPPGSVLPALRVGEHKHLGGAEATDSVPPSHDVASGSATHRWTRFRERGSQTGARLRALGFRSLRPLAITCAATAIGVYLTLGIIHLRYPFELEWMEGGMLDSIQRVAAGQKLYVKPTVEFVPYIYAPLYFYVAALFGKILGVGFLSARLVSYVASVGVLAFVFRLVQRETRNRIAAFCAAGLFAGTYHLAAGFYDIARVDSLFVLLALSGLYTLRFRESVASRVAAAALFTLAFLTKQSALVIFAPVALEVLYRERKRGLVFALAGIGFMAVATRLLNWAHEGWFSYYVFLIPKQHPFVEKMWWAFWAADLMAPLAVGIVLSLFFLIVQKGASGRSFYFMSSGGMLTASWVGRLHTGGWPNVIMPGFAMIAVLFGLGLHAGVMRAADLPKPVRQNAEAFFLVLAILQFACLVYDPRRYIPSARDRHAGEGLLEQIRAVDGDVYVSAHGHYTNLVGKRSFAHEMAIEDILSIRGGRAGPPAVDLREGIKRAFVERRFAAVVSDGDWFRREIEVGYERRADMFTNREVFWPVTGFRARPKTLYLRK